MHAPNLIVLAIAALALWFFTRKFTRSLGRSGEKAGCDCCDGGGSCGRPRRRDARPRP